MKSISLNHEKTSGSGFMQRLLILALVVLAGCGQAFENGEQQTVIPAADPDNPYSLTWQDDGALVIEAEILTPNGCYHAGGPISAGIPEGVTGDPAALSVMVPIDMEDGMCTMALKPVQFKGVIARVPREASEVLVYELWPAGEPVRTRSIPLPPR